MYVSQWLFNGMELGGRHMVSEVSEGAGERCRARQERDEGRTGSLQLERSLFSNTAILGRPSVSMRLQYDTHDHIWSQNDSLLNQKVPEEEECSVPGPHMLRVAKSFRCLPEINENIKIIIMIIRIYWFSQILTSTNKHTTISKHTIEYLIKWRRHQSKVVQDRCDTYCPSVPPGKKDPSSDLLPFLLFHV